MTSRLVTLAIVMFAWAGVTTFALRSEEIPLRARLDTFPSRLGEWLGRELPALDARVAEVLGADDYISRVYTNSAQQAVGLYIGYHASQRQGDTIHSPLNCLPGAGWQPVSNGRITVAVDRRGPLEVNRYIVQKGGERQLVLYWYQSHGRVIASEYWGKFYLVVDSIRMNRSDAALVRIVSPIADREDAEAVASQRAVDFLRTMFPSLVEHLPS
jgi:EpsI family protein